MKNIMFIRPLVAAALLGAIVNFFHNLDLQYRISDLLDTIIHFPPNGHLLQFITDSIPSFVYALFIGGYFLFVTNKLIKREQSILQLIIIIILTTISLPVAMYVGITGSEFQLKAEGSMFLSLIETAFTGAFLIFLSVLPLISFIAESTKKNFISLAGFNLLLLIIVCLLTFTGLAGPHTVFQIGTMFVFMRIFEQYAYYKKQELETGN